MKRSTQIFGLDIALMAATAAASLKLFDVKVTMDNSKPHRLTPGDYMDAGCLRTCSKDKVTCPENMASLDPSRRMPG